MAALHSVPSESLSKAVLNRRREKGKVTALKTFGEKPGAFLLTSKKFGVVRGSTSSAAQNDDPTSRRVMETILPTKKSMRKSSKRCSKRSQR